LKNLIFEEVPPVELGVREIWPVKMTSARVEASNSPVRPVEIIGHAEEFILVLPQLIRR